MDQPSRPAAGPDRDGFGVRSGGHARDVAPVAGGPEPGPVVEPAAAQARDAAPPATGPVQPPVTIAPPDPVALAPGALLVGRYRLTSRVSAGSADVWRAEDELLGRPVALKLAVAASQGSAAAERLLTEARALAAVRHPGVVALHDVLSGRWGTALVLELLPGETLAARLAREGPVSAPIAISIGMQLAAALDGVHRAGLVHRDVKPGNVIVRPDGSVRLIDFGIARPAGERHGLTPSGQVEGTLRSISPEQLAGGAVSPATDLFGMGTVLFELLEGRPPFDAADPERLARLHRLGRPPMILAPAPLADLLARLLEPNPAARPTSAAAVLDQLRAIAGVLGGAGRPADVARRSATQPRPASRGPRTRLRSALLGGLLMLAAGAAVTVGLTVPGVTGGNGAGGGPEASPRRSAAPGGRAGAGVAALLGTPAPTVRPTPKPTPKPTPRPTRTPRPTLPSTFGLDDPVDGATTSGARILVRGHAPPGATVTRDLPLWFDEHTKADAQGRWSMVITLNPGKNRLTFRHGDDRSTEATILVISDPSSGGPVSGG